MPPKPKQVQVCQVKQAHKQQPPQCCQKETVTNVEAQKQSTNVRVIIQQPATQAPSYRLTPQKPIVVTRYRLVKSKPLPAPKWTIFGLAGMAKTGYKLSDSSCGKDTCVGNLSRFHKVDLGAGVIYRYNNNLTVGVVGTKESSFYGVIGWSFGNN
jgi:hypothetical protein